MEEEHNYTVYIHINKTDNKKYVGITKRKPEIRWGCNGKGYVQCKYFWNAIQKYGWNNFYHQIFADGLTKDQAEKMEVQLIQILNTTDSKYGYNICHGGAGSPGCKHTEEEKIRIGNSLRGQHYHDDAFKKRLAERNSKRVMRDDGLIFDTVTEAATFIGVTQPAISNAMKRNKKCKGHYWSIIDKDA